MSGGELTRDRRRRHTFWIDDRVVDEFAPVMGRYPFGTAALAVYAVLARRADRDGESWPRLRSIAEQAATSERTVRRAMHLLELLGLVEVAACYEANSQRQTSNLYTLLTPPDVLPELDPDPAKWPTPQRRTLVIVGGNRSQTVTDARCAAAADEAPQGVSPGQAGSPPPARLAPLPGLSGTPPPASLTPLEGNTYEGLPMKDESCTEATANERWIVEEVGLSNSQVWAAVLSEIERRSDVARTDLEVWLRPAALVGRDGAALVIGVSSAVAQARLERRLLPAVRAALAHVVGMSLPVTVVVCAWGEVMEAAS